MVDAARAEDFGPGLAGGIGGRGRGRTWCCRDREEPPRRAAAKRRLSFGDDGRSQARGAAERKAWILGVPWPTPGQGPSLFRPEPHLCQRADALRQGRRLCPPERHRVAGFADRSRFEARDLGHGRGCPPCPRAEGVSVLAGLAGITLLEPARSRVELAGEGN